MDWFDTHPDTSERLVYVLVLLIGAVACLLIGASLHATDRRRAEAIKISDIDWTAGLESYAPESPVPYEHEGGYAAP